MRGIAGIVRFDSSPLHPEEIDSMIRAMAIGPTDRIATWCDGPAGLGHLLQFFFADDPREIQPLLGRDAARVLVTEARLDNRAELAADFGWNAAEAAAHPDSAFVLAAFEKWGEDCPARLDGRFAFALWQPRERRLFCAVDRLGLSPLYYSHRGGAFVFATTLKGLLTRSHVSRRLNEHMLAEIAVGLRRPTSETLYADVSRIAGGHAMSVDAAGIRLTRYWHPERRPVIRLRSDADYVEAFRAEVKSAIGRSIERLPGEVGLFLSGGLDSSAVAVTASELLAKQGRRLQAIHLVPTAPNRYAPTARELDESRFVRELQAHAPEIDFHFVPAHTASSPLETWDDFFSDHQVPFRSIPGQDDPVLERLLDGMNVGAMLDGRGGNFLVSPETIPTGYLDHLALTGRFSTWWREVQAHRDVYRRPLRWLVRQSTLGAIGRLLLTAPAGANEPDSMLRWLHPDFRARTGIAQIVQQEETAWSRPPLNLRRRFRRLLLDEMAQQSGAPASAISRWPTKRLRLSPLGDWRLNEFCAALPFEQQFRGGWDRRLLREMTRRALPDMVRLRTTRGFGQPEFQQQFAQMAPRLRAELDGLGESAAVRTYLDYDHLCARWDASTETATWGRELSLVNGLALGCFLRWHERQATG